MTPLPQPTPTEPQTEEPPFPPAIIQKWLRHETVPTDALVDIFPGTGIMDRTLAQGRMNLV